MTEIIGRNLEVGVSVEPTRGTSPAAAEKWLKLITADLKSMVEHAQDGSSHNNLADSDQRRVTKKWFQGSIDGIMHYDAIGYFLYNLYGIVSSSEVGASVYDHSFSLENAIQHTALSLYVKDGSVNQVALANGMVGTLDLSFATDDYLKAVIDLMAASEGSNSDTPSYDTEYDAIGKDIVVKISDTEGGLSGAAATKVKSGNIKFDAGLINDFVLGSYNPDDIYNAKMAIEGSLELNYADDTFKDLFESDDAKYMSITITGSQDIGTIYNPTITIILNKVQITGWDRSGANDDLVTETIDFKAFYNETDGEQSTLVLRNLTEEYSTAPSA